MVLLEGPVAELTAEAGTNGWSFLRGGESGARAVMSGFLASTMDDREALAALSARSFHHANGFSKIVLGEEPETGGVLRLHVWRKPVLAATSDPHDHRWGFHSVVLAGRLREERFAETDPTDAEALPARRLCYGSTRSTGRESFAEGGATALRVVAERTISSGDLSSTDAVQIHRITIVEAPAATLVVTRASSDRESTVYRTHKARAGRHTAGELALLSVDAVRDCLGFARASLDRWGGLRARHGSAQHDG